VPEARRESRQNRFSYCQKQRHLSVQHGMPFPIEGSVGSLFLAMAGLVSRVNAPSVAHLRARVSMKRGGGRTVPCGLSTF
jgi:hypothetical protein